MHSDAQFFPNGGTVTEVRAKQRAFERDWDALLARVDTRLASISADICAQIERFIHEVYQKCKRGTVDAPPGQIHTALLLGTVSASDHLALFDELKARLLQKCGRVAVIDCSTKPLTVNHIFVSIDQQCGFSLLKSVSRQSTDVRMAESLRGLSFVAPVCKSKSVDHSKASVRRSHGQIRPSKSMTGLSETESHTGPLVVVIPAVESVPTSVLREFVQITSMRVRECRGVPIFFVFGLMTAEDLVLESHCDAQTLSCLITKRFRMRPPSVSLDAVFTELLRIPGFRASRRIVEYLIDKAHSCLDYSIRNLLDRYKLVMLKHYLALPHPQLLAPLGEAEKFMCSLSESGMARLLGAYRSLQPLAACVKKEGGGRGVSTRQKLSDCLAKHWLIQLLLPFVMEWVLALFGDLHRHSTAGIVARLYCDWSVGRLVSEETVRRFKALPPARVLCLVEASVGSIKASLGMLKAAAGQRGVAAPVDKTKGRESTAWKGVLGSEFLVDEPRWVPCLQQAISVLTELEHAVCDWRHRFAAASESEAVVKVADARPGSKTESVKLEVTKRLTLLELREKLLRGRSSSPASSTRSQWRQTLEDFERWLLAILSPSDSEPLSLVAAPHSLPLWEVFYGPTEEAEIMRLRRNFDPPLISSVHRGLSDCEGVFSGADGLQSAAWDLCAVYKIYRESGSLINVYDWLIAFEALVEPWSGHADAHVDAHADATPSQLIQSRFLRAVADLEQMGLVRRTGRRRDHAQKLPVMQLNFVL